MSATSSRTVQIQYSGDITQTAILSALDNVATPAQEDIITLGVGANTISPPSVAGLVITGLTIVPPAGNITVLTMKGVTGDIGVPLHITDPTSLALDPSFINLVLTVTVAIAGVRLIWT